MARSDRIRITQRIREAEGYLELGMPTSALEALSRIDDAGTSQGQLRFLEGLAYRELERHSEAIAPLRDATDAIPSNLGTWIALAWCQKRCGQLAAAIDTLFEAKEFHDDEPLIDYNLACYFSLDGQKPVAISHLAAAIDADPSYRDLVHEETDFDPLRSDPDFLAVTSVIV